MAKVREYWCSVCKVKLLKTIYYDKHTKRFYCEPHYPLHPKK